MAVAVVATAAVDDDAAAAAADAVAADTSDGVLAASSIISMAVVSNRTTVLMTRRHTRRASRGSMLTDDLGEEEGRARCGMGGDTNTLDVVVLPGRTDSRLSYGLVPCCSRRHDVKLYLYFESFHFLFFGEDFVPVSVIWLFGFFFGKCGCADYCQVLFIATQKKIGPIREYCTTTTSS